MTILDNKKMNLNPKICVITVCYNAEKDIAMTIESVCNQKFDGLEFIIIDGKSNDNTVTIAKNIIEKYISIFDRVLMISEPDQGIYDAMNKAYRLAEAKWIVYMNAGDIFVDKMCLDDLYHVYIENPSSSVIYGNAIMKYNGMYKLDVAQDVNRIVYEIPFCHQSVMTDKALLMRYGYNTNYKICADYDFYLKLYLDGYKFSYLDRAISVYDMGGFSSNDGGINFFKERNVVRFNNKVLTKNEYNDEENWLINYSKKYKIKKKVKKCIPKTIMKRYSTLKLKKDGWSESINNVF